MRALPTIVAAVFLAGCASAPSIDTAKVVDHKYNTIRYASKQQESEFVGTSANASGSTKRQPSWYKYGHP
jgi:outer membrane PBP1 activator LpoA protein